MKEKIRPTEQLDLFRSELKAIINLNHELCQLADKIRWQKFEIEFAGYPPAKGGNPALSSRLIIGNIFVV